MSYRTTRAFERAAPTAPFYIDVWTVFCRNYKGTVSEKHVHAFHAVWRFLTGQTYE